MYVTQFTSSSLSHDSKKNVFIKEKVLLETTSRLKVTFTKEVATVIDAEWSWAGVSAALISMAGLYVLCGEVINWILI